MTKKSSRTATDVPLVGTDAPLGAIAVALLARWRGSPGGLLFVARSEQRAERLGSILYALDRATDAVVFPRWDRLPYDSIPPSREVMGRRTSVLRRLAERSRPPLVLTTPEAILQHVPSTETWQETTLRIRPGDPLQVDALRAFLMRTGYALDGEADEPGEAAIHGHVIDIYPAGALGPVRVELDETGVASLASFDRASQRTTHELPEVTLDAASEIVQPEAAQEPAPGISGVFERHMAAHYAQLATVFDYLPNVSMVRDPAIEDRVTGWLDAASAGRAAPAKGGDERSFYLSAASWDEALRDADVLPAGLGRCEPVPVFALEERGRAAYGAFVRREHAAGRTIVLAAAHGNDRQELTKPLTSARLNLEDAETWEAVDAASAGSCFSMWLDIETGFTLPDQGVAVIAAADLLGSRARHNAAIATRRAALEADGTFHLGDAVLHLEHGLGILDGLETVTAPGLPERDFIRLRYAGDATVMVPAEEVGAIWRYGGDPDALTLDKADGESWRKRRDSVSADIETTAQSLVEMAGAQAARKAPKLTPPPADYERFVAGFPYFATPDQAAAVEDILADLASGTPMNRLVCGDVGFGKTEVALRAAAAAVLAGRQVAVIAPTTVLARQHAEVFGRRFAPFGIAVAQLSRLTSATESKRVKTGLVSGDIRLVVGTHAVASKTVRFADLGLLVIDEEQRFGARDKAKLSELAPDAHRLIMTATPIPRTLLAAQAGLQSLSILATPPARRVPVQTVVASFGDGIVREALLWEKRRGGQSFVVCPRIEDIDAMAERIAAIAPDLVLRVVHGKLPPTEVDDTMVRFGDGDGDVLLATNIIESGLDVPRANTILITRPDRLGLAQLHQLRGRVGRGSRRGKAFLLTEGKLEKTAAKRLEVFTSIDGIGAGFAISQRDMDLRGAGDLLGEEQAGHVKLLGADLHRHLLANALRRARGEDTGADWMPDVHLDELAVLPATYVPDKELRLNLYARLARTRTREDVDAFGEELADRFGPLPPAAGALLRRAAIAITCRSLGITRVDAGPQAIAMSFINAAARPETESAGTHWKGERLIRPVDAQSNSGADLVLETLDAIGA